MIIDYLKFAYFRDYFLFLTLCSLFNRNKSMNEFFSVQERLTKQIAVAISQSVQPAGVAVVIEAR